MVSFQVQNDIHNERNRQVQLWGTEQQLLNDLGLNTYLHKKMMILIEEVGEYAKEVNDKRLDEMYTEAIQVAAVAIAICEGIHFFMENQSAV